MLQKTTFSSCVKALARAVTDGKYPNLETVRLVSSKNWCKTDIGNVMLTMPTQKPTEYTKHRNE
jgi:hypothetical protein